MNGALQGEGAYGDSNLEYKKGVCEHPCASSPIVLSQKFFVLLLRCIAQVN